MFDILKARFGQGYRTIKYPGTMPSLPERFKGLPVINSGKCPDSCQECVEVCPTDAIISEGGKLKIDLGKCIFCNECALACPEGAINFTNEFRMSARKREDLIVVNGRDRSLLAEALDFKMQKLLGRALKLRQVSAGGCNGCESDVNVLNTIVFDLSRFGIQFVASPRQADGILITGPVTKNMKEALFKTYEAIPTPKIVIAVGACAINGGPFINLSEVNNGVDTLLPVDLYIPGCPPHPLTILDGILRLLGKLPKQK
jgi:Ni,Fe-hydrogenase III small subunit/formate hydrogenlyase subunit 6/NADH:ubiquinone oxidoreductase subunit I